MSWRVDEAESWEGRPLWRAIFSEEGASMLLYLHQLAVGGGRGQSWEEGIDSVA